jgi:uncharacterized protein YndB with AHSA1/START domain
MPVVGAGSPADPTFLIARGFKAPRARVWEAWTRPELLARWFGPKGATTTILAHDLRPGGRLHGRMATPEGTTLWFRFVYREAVEPARLVWVHSFADENGEVAPSPFGGPWPRELLTTVTFADERADTRVHLTWVPLNATAEERAAFIEAVASMSQGWSGSFEQLDAVVARAG